MSGEHTAPRRGRSAFGTIVAALTQCFVAWYALALLMPQFGMVQPMLGIGQYGNGTAYALPLLSNDTLARLRGDAQPVATFPTAAASSTATPDANLVTGPDAPPTTVLRELTTVPVRIEYKENPCSLASNNLGPNVVFVGGCVTSDRPTVIVLSESSKTMSAEGMRALVAHELGHVYQARLAQDFLESNKAVVAAFDGPSDAPNAEQLADCMSMYRTGRTSGSYVQSCTPHQLAVAAQVWAGVTPGADK